ncbi:MAG TPA: hypothetical protein VMX94_08000 [Armatimonadota bacterium]|nr:hypothetical protein [Armatimonadota bacterium]
MRFVSLFGLLAVILTAQCTCADEVQWRVVRTRHFLIYYAAGADSTAKRAGDLAEKWHVTLSRKLKFSPGGLTPIYLYPDRRSFSEATGVDPGEQTVGIAHTRTLKVRVDASGTFADIADVIPHELVHVFISRRLRWNSNRMPLWMHEGLAKYLADDWTGPDADLLADAASGEILPLDRISRAFPVDERKRSIAYVQSYSAVKYMADTYSPDSIPDLLSELETGQPFTTALFYSIGSKPKEFEEEWRQYLWEEYSWARWARLASGLAWSAMGVLAILAFRARVLQKRRRARELEEEAEHVE